MRLLSTLRPTSNQLRVIAKIAASQDVPARAAAEISSSANLIAARNLLMKLNVITYTDNSATLTDIGQQLAQEQNITDEGGQLTDEGNKLAASESNGKPDKEIPAQNQEQSSMGGGQLPGTEDLSEPPMEGFSLLFKDLLNG